MINIWVERVINSTVQEYKSGARIGANATILAGVTIGKETTIGAGAVVTSDIPDYKVALGIPARVVKEVPKDQRLHLENE